MPLRSFTFILFALVAVYGTAGWFVAVMVDATDRFSWLMYSRPVLTTTLLLASLFFSGICLKIMVMNRPAHLTRAIMHEMKTIWLTRERLAQGLPVVAAFLVFMAVFTSLKTLIPVVQPYGWDAFFMQADRLVHGGRDAWTWLQPVMGFPIITFVINVIYNMWFPVMFGALYWQAFSLSRPDLRSRFFLSFFLCWIINGTVLAMVFSSAGPCFYGELLPHLENPYLPLMAYLREAALSYPLWSLATQEMLWTYYLDGGLHYGSGISAMPSLHVSIAFLLMLLGYKINRGVGHGFAAFFVCIMVGSVHLGWHYAVDGYLSIITTAFIWWGMGKLRV